MVAQQRKSCSAPCQVCVEAAHTAPCRLEAALLAAKQRYKHFKQHIRHQRLGTGENSALAH